MKRLLIELGACKDAREWAGDKSWPEIYSTCHRADWLLWLFERMSEDRRRPYLAHGMCLRLINIADKISEVLIAYGNGSISESVFVLKRNIERANIGTVPFYVRCAIDTHYSGSAMNYIAAGLSLGAYRLGTKEYRKKFAESQMLMADTVRSVIPIEMFKIEI